MIFMGLKHILRNSWNETHEKNKQLLKQYGMLNKLGMPSNDFSNFLRLKNMRFTKDLITVDLIEEYKGLNNIENIASLNINNQKINHFSKSNEFEKNKKIEILKDKIRENEKIAWKLKNDGDMNGAIKLYEENIATGEYCRVSYNDLFYIYSMNNDYENAIDILKRQIVKCKEIDCDDIGHLKEDLKNLKMKMAIDRIAKNNQKIKDLEEQGMYDELIPLHILNLNEKDEFDDYILPFNVFGLSRVYHYKKEFKKEYDVLENGYERLKVKKNVNRDVLKGLYENLENVGSYLKTGKFKNDCLPSDSKQTYFKIKEAKEILKGDKEKGIMLLENIMAEGSYNNTVYYTLYKTYMADNRYDDAIRVCNKAIEVLGLFSQDRIEKYTKYLEKIPTYKKPLNDLKQEELLQNNNINKVKSISKANDNYKISTKYCMKCNSEISESLNVCPNCQYDFKNNYYVFEDRSYLNYPLFVKIPQKELKILNKDIKQISSSKKAKFEYNSKELFVEEVVMEYYKQRGYSAIWSENTYWCMIYALLFWDIIFMPTDTCVQVPMNHKDFKMHYDFLVNSEMFDMPRDFFKSSFYPQRKNAIEKRIKELINSNISQIIKESFYQHYGERCRAIWDWNKYSIDELTIPLKSLKNEQIILIMDRMLHDFAYCSTGFPDVIIFNEREFIFIEAKSKNDRVSDSQMEWHEYLLNTVKVEVILFTLNKSERQIKNIVKKYKNISKKEYTMSLSFDLETYDVDDMSLLSDDELLNKQKDNELFAKELEKVNRIKDALKLYKANINTNAPFKDSYNQLANYYAKRNDYDNAIKICKLGLSNVENVKDQNFLRRRIDIFENNKNLDKKSNLSIKEFKSTISNEPQVDMYCIYCGTGLSKDSNFCHNCGKKVND